MLTGGSGAVKAEFTGANMVMLRSGLLSADACPKPCTHKCDLYETQPSPCVSADGLMHNTSQPDQCYMTSQYTLHHCKTYSDGHRPEPGGFTCVRAL